MCITQKYVRIHWQYTYMYLATYMLNIHEQHLTVYLHNSWIFCKIVHIIITLVRM